MADMHRRDYELPAVPQEPEALIRQAYAPKASPQEFSLYLNICHALGFDPRAKQIYLISRYDKRLGRDVATIQLGIDGYRLLAQRSGAYGGTDLPQWCGPDGVWREVWLDETPPAACKIAV